MFRLLGEIVWDVSIEMRGDYMEYPTLQEQNRLSCYVKSEVVSEGRQGNPTPGGDPDMYKLPEGVDDSKDGVLDGAIGGEFSQRIGVHRKLLDSQDECETSNREFAMNVA